MSKKKKVVENETNNTRTEIEEKNTDEEFKEIEKEDIERITGIKDKKEDEEQDGYQLIDLKINDTEYHYKIPPPFFVTEDGKIFYDTSHKQKD